MVSLTSYLPDLPIFCKTPFCKAPAASNTDPVFLLQAVQNGDLESLKENLPNFQPEIVNILINGEALLSAAIKFKSLPLMQYLIQKGARLDLVDQQRMTPLDYAALSLGDEILPTLISEWILRDKAQIGAYLNDAPLMKLAEESLKHLEINMNGIRETDIFNLVKLYVNNPPEREKIADILYPMANKALDQHGTTLFHLLACLSPIAPEPLNDLFKSLVEKGADPSIQNFFGQTPLHTASAYKSPLMQTLAKAGCDFFQHDREGIPPVALISVDPTRKDPLKLEATEAFIAAFIVLNQAASFLPEASTYRIAGLTVPELGSYSLVMTQLYFLIKKQGISSIQSQVVSTVLIHALLNGLSLVSGRQIVDMLTVLPTSLIAFSAFQGLKKAWKNSDWKPLTAFRNAAVHTINFTHSTYSLANRMANLGTHIMHTYYGRYDKVRESAEGLKSWQEKANQLRAIKVDLNLQAKCTQNASFISETFCKELDQVKEGFDELNNTALEKMACFNGNIKKEHEEMQSEGVLSKLWDFILGNKTPVEKHLATLGIDPRSEGYINNPGQEIKRTYHARALQCHPDTHNGTVPAGCPPFSEITAAHDFFDSLKDKQKC